MRSAAVPELNLASVADAYRQRAHEVCPEHLSLAERTLGRLQPQQWALEWYLPWWLGHAFGVDDRVSGEIVLGNVLGLASIRLQDDLLDDEVSPDEIGPAKALSAALYEAAIAVYRAQFPGSSFLWDRLSSWMAEWREAANQNGGPDGGDGPLDAAPRLSHLARRGAPLKISALAMCLLADRIDTFRPLERGLDHALTAMVLYDHLCDWEADLVANRWNAFVAAVSGSPQVPAWRDRNRSRVLVAVMTEEAVASHFARIDIELVRAIRAIRPLGVSPLAHHIERYAARTREQGVAVRSHYRGVADQATRFMFGDRVSKLEAVRVRQQEGVAR